jgi:hypothetical protein
MQSPNSEPVAPHCRTNGFASAPRSLLTREGPLTESELHQVLQEFRDTVVAVEMTPWERHRSILRDGMIETFIAQRVADPTDWARTNELAS